LRDRRAVSIVPSAIILIICQRILLPRAACTRTGSIIERSGISAGAVEVIDERISWNVEVCNGNVGGRSWIDDT